MKPKMKPGRKPAPKPSTATQAKPDEKPLPPREMPRIVIGIRPASIDDLLNPIFEAEERRLKQLHESAPELAAALKLAVQDWLNDPAQNMKPWVQLALAALKKAEGK